MSKLNLLLKLKALAEKGLGGEKINAEKKMRELMRRYLITDEDLLIDKPEIYWFKFRTDAQAQMLVQVVAKVLNDKVAFFVQRNKSTNRKVGRKCGVMLTPSQAVEVDFLYDFYWRLFQKEQKTFFHAFVCKHKLSARNEDASPESPEQIAKILSQMRGMDDASPYRQIKGNL